MKEDERSWHHTLAKFPGEAGNWRDRMYGCRGDGNVYRAMGSGAVLCRETAGRSASLSVVAPLRLFLSSPALARL